MLSYEPDTEEEEFAGKLARSREQEIRQEQKRETRREMRMIMAVVLAVLAIIGGIVYLALRRTLEKETNQTAPQEPAGVTVVMPKASDPAGKEHLYVRT